MIWFLFAGLALLAALFLLWPVRARVADAMPDPLAHYKAQIAGLKADLASGLIDAEAAKVAETEIERRLLKMADSRSASTTLPEKTVDWRFRLALGIVMVAGAVALYMRVGAPMLPAAIPERERLVDQPLMPGEPTYAEAIARIRERLKTNPDDLKALEFLGQVSATVGDFGTAADAFARRADMEPAGPNVWRLHELEALTALVQGQVSPAAELVLDEIEKDVPGHPAVFYYRGLAALQGGDQATAISRFEAIVDGVDRPGPYRDAALARLRELGARPPAVTDDAVAAFAEMSEEERQAFIESMVARLEARLESAPNDPAGWMMLARARLTLGDREAAISVLEKGIAAISGDDAASLRALLDKLRESGEP